MNKETQSVPKRFYWGVGNKVFDADAHDMICSEPAKHAKEAALVLSDNRWSYLFTPKIEGEIVKSFQEKEVLDRLVEEAVTVLECKDGDLRVGAAELLGVITPAEMIDTVIPALNRHLDDNYMRDYVYGGYPGDEEDMRTVSQCAKTSIEQLRKKKKIETHS